MEKIEFGKEEYALLINLKNEVSQCHIQHQENVTEIQGLKTLIEAQNTKLSDQKKIIDRMIWASSKVGLFVAGLCGAFVWLGNWLMSAANFQAVKTFFDTINKGN